MRLKVESVGYIDPAGHLKPGDLRGRLFSFQAL